MTSGSWQLKIPKEFLEKYPYIRAFKSEDGGYFLPISLDREIKFYDDFSKTDIFLDIQKLLIEQKLNHKIDFVLLHECGGITKVEVSKDLIVGIEPTDWRRVEKVEHDYCYGCSDVKNQ